MKILFVAPMPMFAFVGGIQRVTDVLTTELKNQGHYVEYLCYRNSKYKGDINSLPVKQNMIKYNSIDKDRFINEYLRLIESIQFDCIIFQWVDDIVAKWLVSTPRKFKIISVVHQQPYANRGFERYVAKNSFSKNIKQAIATFIDSKFPFFRRCISDKYWNNNLTLLTQYSDKVCFLSNRFIPRIEKINHSLRSEKYCGINDPCTFPLKKEIDLSKKENMVILVCRINNAQKNITGFLNVWKNFSKKHQDWSAYILGDGPDLEVCKQYSKKIGNKNVEFLGYCKNVSEYFSRAKIQCITSSWEGFSMVLVEGMSFGCIPVAFDTYEALYDIIDNMESGMISPAFDYDHMANNMARIAENPFLYEKMAKRTFYNCSRFEVSKIVSEWITLINNIKK